VICGYGLSEQEDREDRPNSLREKRSKWHLLLLAKIAPEAPRTNDGPQYPALRYGGKAGQHSIRLRVRAQELSFVLVYKRFCSFKFKLLFQTEQTTVHNILHYDTVVKQVENILGSERKSSYNLEPDLGSLHINWKPDIVGHVDEPNVPQKPSPRNLRPQS
jgi:hypothetical protein